MIGAHRRRIDKLDREKVMITDNAADFPKNSPVDLITVEIDAKVAEILARDAALVSAYGDKQQAREIKGDARDYLLGNFHDVIIGAVAIGNAAVPGITAKFKMPEPDSASEHYGEAVGALNALVRETMALSRQRSALVKLKYKNNPGKLAAWEIASHLEAAPKPADKPKPA